MSTKYPETDSENTVRDEGTVFHKVMYHQAIGWGNVEVGTVLNGIVVDEAMVDFAEIAADYMRGWKCKVWLEKQIPCTPIHPDCGGSPDAFGIDYEKRIIYVFDAKYGYRPVSAYECWQLACYLAGILQIMDAEGHSSHLDDQWKVAFIIFQPRTPGKQFDTWVFDLAGEGRAMINTLRNAATAVTTEVEGSTLRAGTHCYRCSAAAHCPALRRDALSALDTIETYHQQDLTPAELSHEKMLLERARGIIETRDEALAIELEARLRNGDPVPGYTLRPKRSRIRWKESSKALVIDLARAMGLGDISKKQEPLGPRAAEKIVGTNFINQHCETPPGSLTLHRQTAEDIRRVFSKD